MPDQASAPEAKEEVPQTKADPQPVGVSSMEDVVAQCKDSMAQVKEFSPFLHTIGRRICVGALWGGVFGLVFFRSWKLRKFSFIYGAGFGFGMNASTIS